METSGINVDAVSRWLEANTPGVAPFTFSLVAGGRSNLTFRVEDATGAAFALRRPPVSHVLPTAHDMVREFTVISALAPTGVPVPTPLALCIDDAVNGRPFYVMEFVDGAILRTRDDAVATYDEATRGAIGEHLAETLAALHEVDVDGAGLGALARHDGYIERQVRRWRGQYDQMVTDGAPADPMIAAVGERLAAAVPLQQAVSVVHGDYRLDNTVLDDDGRVRAILDWEICTLGDPVADLGTLLCYWAEPGDPTESLLGLAPTLAPGFLTRDQVVKAYARHSRLDLSHVAYYLSFAYWRLACIIQGVYARYQAGAGAGDPGSVDEMPRYVSLLATRAFETLENG